MNSDLDDIYKPLRVTIKGKVRLIDTMNGKYVVKKKTEGISDIFNYLKLRNFEYIPKLIKDSRVDYDIYEYNEDVAIPLEQKAEDLVNVVALLHNKTSYFKEVSQDKFKEIYEGIKNNLVLLKNHYTQLFDSSLLCTFMSPSQYLLTRNFSAINGAIVFCESELDKWFALVKDSTQQRVARIHNNLSMDHFIKGDSDYLISWDLSTVDTPLLDFVKFYKRHYYDLEFSHLLEVYLNGYELNDAEMKLMFILIVIPDDLEFIDNEYDSTNKVRRVLDYIYKTERLTTPYYSVKKEE